eukprot:tig00000681_g3097.t1
MNSLPDELLACILGRLDPRDLASVVLVCRRLHEAWAGEHKAPILREWARARLACRRLASNPAVLDAIEAAAREASAPLPHLRARDVLRPGPGLSRQPKPYPLAGVAAGAPDVRRQQFELRLPRVRQLPEPGFEPAAAGGGRRHALLCTITAITKGGGA